MTLPSSARLALPAICILAAAIQPPHDAWARPAAAPDRVIRENLQEQIARVKRSKQMLNALGLNFVGADFSARSKVATFTFVLNRGVKPQEARSRLARASRMQKASICRNARPLLLQGVSMNVQVLDSAGRSFSGYTFSRRNCG